MKSGLRLIERVIKLAEEKKLPTAPGKNPFIEPLETAENFSALFPDFAEHIKTILDDRAHYEEDLKHVDTFEAELPFDLQNSTTFQSTPTSVSNALQTGYKTAKVLAFKRQPKSKLYRFWIRDEGEYQLLMTPSNPNPDDPTRFRRWRISVDPNQSEYHLRRLGYLLEQEETEEFRHYSYFETRYISCLNSNDDFVYSDYFSENSVGTVLLRFHKIFLYHNVI